MARGNLNDDIDDIQPDEKFPPIPLPLDTSPDEPPQDDEPEALSCLHTSKSAEELAIIPAVPDGKRRRTDEMVIRGLAAALPMRSHVLHTGVLPKELLELVVQFCVDLLSIGDEFERTKEYIGAYPWYEVALTSLERDYLERRAATTPTSRIPAAVAVAAACSDKKRSSVERKRSSSISAAQSFASSGNAGADANYAHALFQVAFYLRVGMNSVLVDDERSSRLMLQAIELGYVPSYAPMSRCYFYGKGVPKDLARARELIMMGYEANDPACIYYAAREYSNPTEKKARFARCVGELEKRAQQGDFMYMFLWADAHQGGHGVPPNKQISLEWFRKMAIMGHANAQNELAVALELGGHWSKDAAADAAEAFKWYTAGAEQNFRIAVRNLGDCYRDGFGCKRDRERASQLYARALALGDPDAAGRMRPVPGQAAPVVPLPVVADAVDNMPAAAIENAGEPTAILA
jgi:TPR repeat protein